MRLAFLSLALRARFCLSAFLNFLPSDAFRWRLSFFGVIERFNFVSFAFSFLIDALNLSICPWKLAGCSHVGPP